MFLLIASLGWSCGHSPEVHRETLASNSASETPRSPDELYGELFSAVQLGRVFEDQKAFADAVPKQAPAEIMRDFASAKHDPKLDLKAFGLEHFALSVPAESAPPRGLALMEHIEWLWPRLTREGKTVAPGHSLLALPKPYVAPDGRYQELYARTSSARNH